MKTTECLMESAVKLIDAQLKDEDSVEAGVVVMTKKADYIFPIDGPAPSPAHTAVIKKITKARKAGGLVGVVHVAEAWSAPSGLGLSPSTHPGRREIIIAYVRGEDGSCMSCWLVERGSYGMRRGAALYENSRNVYCWLDAAFEPSTMHKSGTA